jgi:hypothetical protein
VERKNSSRIICLKPLKSPSILTNNLSQAGFLEEAYEYMILRVCPHGLSEILQGRRTCACTEKLSCCWQEIHLVSLLDLICTF